MNTKPLASYQPATAGIHSKLVPSPIQIARPKYSQAWTLVKHRVTRELKEAVPKAERVCRFQRQFHIQGDSGETS